MLKLPQHKNKVVTCKLKLIDQSIIDFRSSFQYFLSVHPGRPKHVPDNVKYKCWSCTVDIQKSPFWYVHLIKPDTADKLLHHVNMDYTCSNLLGTKKLFQIVTNFGQPKSLEDNQKLQPACPWPLFFLNWNTGQDSGLLYVCCENSLTPAQSGHCYTVQSHVGNDVKACLTECCMNTHNFLKPNLMGHKHTCA